MAPELETLCKLRVLGSWPLCQLFLGPEFQLTARWNRAVEAVKMCKTREKTGKEWARYSLKRVKEGIAALFLDLVALIVSR